MNRELITSRMQGYALTTFGMNFEDLGNKEKYTVFSKAIMEDILPQWQASLKKFDGKKKAYYLSAEFLMGRALSNNLINLRKLEEMKEMLEGLGIDYNALEEAESDAGLGNGGLGRLAACFLDSAATLNYSLTGYGIRYNYGIFEQQFINGYQVEKGDEWLSQGDSWSVRREDKKVLVTFKDQTVVAVPYDTPIIGFGGDTINTLRLWQSEAVNVFDFGAFNNQDYDKAVKEKNDAENISKVLYPNDSMEKGKILRLKQQYFFVSASLQDLIREHKKNHNDFKNFAKLHAVQLNDTHPAVAVPELVRLLGLEGVSFKKAMSIAVDTFAYTNHTILKEALEQWSVKLYKKILPDVYKIIVKIDNMMKKELLEKGVSEEKLSEFAIIADGNIKMAWLSIYGTHSTNGVAQLHTNILKETELREWYLLYPERFNNKTNGITQRRWLVEANPRLAEFITDLLGNEEWITNLDNLKELKKFASDDEIIGRFIEIKKSKKKELKEYILAKEGVDIDENSIFDIQIKRLHEYKRQILNAFHILYLYNRLKEDETFDITPRTFIFGAKAAPGYDRAKAIIKFINAIAELVNNDESIKGKIKVVFVENYGVSYAQRLFPAADISEQISTAGKEASGTGNMKFMLNGAPTIGTFDGANVEIVEEAGLENNYIFGLTVEQIEEIKDSYDPVKELKKNKRLQKVVDALTDGTFDLKPQETFEELKNSLLKGASWHTPDNYFVIKDFDAYVEAQEKVGEDFKNELEFYRKAFINMASAGKFSSDRTIEEYAKEIWNIESITTREV
ncbi:glycogen/starch/alpha-glucan phosphorylase [Proteiniclasticum ruminis]|uniref:Alpha-1,4 glucan phosphorylase n=1 Tax=Proteiniclasticum ruminis TaxID=398199 RepID=A0A1I4ZW33_9CLOT|nr:glycogen/starch/alpha-glucan phosphorylase [Proteiniclasticum ruminis]SFN54445.1 maltodextrin phosphorylase [Proteiniclasticum ruminis]